MLQKKRETEAKLLWANKPDKLQLAKEEIVEVFIFFIFNTLSYTHSKLIFVSVPENSGRPK